MNKQQDKQTVDDVKGPQAQDAETPVSDAEEWKNKYLRALADYQNLEKRTAQRHLDSIQMASRSLITRLLPVFDVFYKVHESLKDQGMALAMKQLEEVFTTEGVTKINVTGKPFDPETMECIEVVEGKEDDTVVEETRAGYKLHDQVIRPAQVKVGKKKIN